MKYSYLIVIIVIVLSSCTPKILELNSKLESVKDSKEKILIPNGSLYKLVEKKAKNINYNFGVNSKSEVVYISTSDPKFSIEGINMNSLFSDISKKNKVEYISGWAYYVKINSEWYAAYNLKTPPKATDKISWFFKYKFSEGNKDLFK
jgi:hypothetical protein